MRRIWVVFSFFILLFAGIVFRLFYWTVIAGDGLRQAAADQYYLELSLPATRGSILASDGKPIVMNEIAYLVYAEPHQMDATRSAAQAIASVLSLDSKDVEQQLTQPNRVWVPIAHKVPDETAAQLKALGLRGLGFEKESRRYYPEGSMAAQLLGFVGSDENGNDKGYFGLEGYYDRELRGKDGRLIQEKDAHGRPILIGDSQRIEPEHGRSLVLWLDRMIQYIAEKRLLEGIQKYGALEGSVIIMDPKTGGVLAMASYPSYDPSKFYEFDKSLYKNPVVASSYEPGSTFKTLVMSAGIADGSITSSTIVDESGPVPIGNYLISTWNHKYHGPISTTKVLEYSSNVGMVYVEKKLGKDKFLNMFHSYDFGKLSGVDLEDEASPDLRPDKEWGEIDLATASFGQGIALTPLQMVRSVAAIANDGWLMKPKMVKEIQDVDGKTLAVQPEKIRQVMDSKTAHVVTEMMVDAVDNGEAKWAKPSGYRIAGKTGTAQIPVEGHYDNTKTIASFVGFAPADDPKYVMLVTLREPKSSQWGSETAAPLFFTISRDLFRYWGISPLNS